MTIQFPRVGDRFQDRYVITEVLGAGGMSRVYGAVQDGLDRKVAIKLLAPAGAENLTSSQFDNIVARFEREAKLISSFRSSHTVVMYDYGRSGDYLFMILEHVDGQNLHQLVEANGPLPAERVARIVRQALASLAEAHQMGILHRDIKPQNIMVYEHLGDPDNVKVLDFGIAKAIGETGKDQRKLTEERTIVGTPSYMSPEQILGNKLSPASDIYSLGLVAYEMLFGIVAIEADSAVSTMARHLAPAPIEIPDNRQMPADFLNILRKMISKDVALRYGSVMEVLDDLAAWDGGDANLTLPRISASFQRYDTYEHAPPAGGPPQATEQADKNQPLVVGSALLLALAILIAVGVVVALVWMMQERPADDELPADPPVAEITAPVKAEPSLREIVVEPVAAEVAAVPSEDTPELAADPPEPSEEVADGEDSTEPAQEVAANSEKKVTRSARTKTEPKSDAPEPAEPQEAVEPPEPLVVVPPQPEPAADPAPAEVTAEAPKPDPAPKKPTVAESSSKKTTAVQDSKGDAKKTKKKKKKKKTAPPLSF